MKVRCFRIFNAKGCQIEQSSWLTIGNIYRVLEIYVVKDARVKFRVVSDDNATPAYFLWSEFEIVTQSIPSCWVVRFQASSHMILGPSEWMAPDFWEHYFDPDKHGHAEAGKTFEDIYHAMIAEEP